MSIALFPAVLPTAHRLNIDALYGCYYSCAARYDIASPRRTSVRRRFSPEPSGNSRGCVRQRSEQCVPRTRIEQQRESRERKEGLLQENIEHRKHADGVSTFNRTRFMLILFIGIRTRGTRR